MTLDESSFRFACDLARQGAAIELLPGKEYLVTSRLAPIAKELGLGTVGALLDRTRAEGAPALRQRIVEALTTNETLFFRDKHPFDCLRERILPEIIQRKQQTRSLRILSAACSTGQEPYTLGMILKEHFQELEHWSVQILATDLNEQVLARAQQGRYRQLEVGRGLPANYLAKYFKRAGADWQVSDAVRRLIVFKQQNLTRPWPAHGVFDLILLRNILIYFSPETKATVLRQAATALGAGGLLLLGAAENTLGLDVPLERVTFDTTTVYRPR